MTQVHRLRLAFERRYAIIAADSPHKSQPLQAFLALPIRERLVLLCLLDRADEQAIRTALPYVKQSDVRLTSKTMQAAAITLTKAIETPTLWIDPTRDEEKQLNNIFYPSAAVLLFGNLVPVELNEMGLRARLALYCLVVEEMKWVDVQELLGCTEWFIKQSLKQAMEELDAKA